MHLCIKVHLASLGGRLFSMTRKVSAQELAQEEMNFKNMVPLNGHCNLSAIPLSDEDRVEGML